MMANLPPPRPARGLLTLLILLPGLSPASDTPNQPASDLTEVSLETLMNMEVSSPGRKEQKLRHTAGAVYVVTQEDIHRSGATSIPEVLRMVPGLQVAQIDSSKWAVTSRGFGGRFANKMLVLIDGRSVYNNIYSGVYWDQNDVPVEDIERIEVVRGPGATMWGANAVNGVIHIITKPARETQGLTVTAGAGNEERGFGSVRYGGKLRDGTFYRAYTKYFNRGPLQYVTGWRAHDQWDSARGGGRLDWKISRQDSVTLEGDGYSGGAQQAIYPGYPNNTLSPALSDSIGLSGGYGLGRWEHLFSERSDMALQFSFSQENRSEGFGELAARIGDFDFQHHWALNSRHDLMWGLGFRVYNDQVESHRLSAVPSSFVRLVPPASTQPLASAFAQDQISLVPEQWTLTLGTKLERNVYTGFETQPSVRLLWTPTPEQGLWAAVSRAERTPARSDRDLLLEFQAAPIAGVAGTLRGSPQFQSETVAAYEAGYRNQPARWVTADLATFFCRYSRLRSMDIGSSVLEMDPQPRLLIPLQWGNNAAGHTYGVEIATNWSVTRQWRLSANYSWFRYVLDRAHLGPKRIPVDIEGTSPAHQVQFRSQLDISRKLTCDTGIYFVSALSGMSVPAYVRTDARLGWRPTREAEISLGGQNLLNGRHLEFLPNDYVQGSEPGRTAYLKVTWTF
jgi:iron complex outermembrane receptor protein